MNATGKRIENINRKLNQDKFQIAVALATELIEAYPSLKKYWQLGEKVNDLFEGKRADNATLIEISTQSGLGVDSIRKSKKFQVKYTVEQVEELTQAKFRVSWHLVANNLRVPSDEFMVFCLKCDNAAELNNAVSTWREKNPTAQGRPAADSNTEATKDDLKSRVGEARTELEDLHTRLSGLIDDQDEDGKSILEALAGIIAKLG